MWLSDEILNLNSDYQNDLKFNSNAQFELKIINIRLIAVSHLKKIIWSGFYIYGLKVISCTSFEIRHYLKSFSYSYFKLL